MCPWDDPEVTLVLAGLGWQREVRALPGNAVSSGEALASGFGADFSRFLLPLQALRCAGSWMQAGGRVLVTLLRLLLLPGQLRGSLGDVGPRKWAPGEPDLPESFPSGEDFPFPSWLPLLLFYTWLPLVF